MRLLMRVVLITLFLASAGVTAEAQNVFRIRFDTVTAKAGDTVTVIAYYTFTSTHSHAINYFQARLTYDTSEIYPVAYVLGGTASGMFFDTTSSHLGITARGQSEIDLSNPVLFRIKFRVNRQLADTAFLKWDSSFVLFDASENVDQVVTQDGWIRTASAAGHVVIHSPPVTVRGVTEGYSPDSVAFQLPINTSDFLNAKMRSGVLSFTYDSTELSLQGAISGFPADFQVDSVRTTALMGGRRAARVSMHAITEFINGGEYPLVGLQFVGLVPLDTLCSVLEDVSLRATNSDAFIGNTDYIGDSICLEGTAPSGVGITERADVSLSIYPNPAASIVSMQASGFERAPTIGVYDVLGRLVEEWNSGSVAWHVPADVTPGVYRVIAESLDGTRIARTLVIER